MFRRPCCLFWDRADRVGGTHIVGGTHGVVRPLKRHPPPVGLVRRADWLAGSSSGSGKHPQRDQIRHPLPTTRTRIAVEQSVTHRRGTISVRFSAGRCTPAAVATARDSVTNGARLSSSFAPPKVTKRFSDRLGTHSALYTYRHIRPGVRAEILDYLSSSSYIITPSTTFVLRPVLETRESKGSKKPGAAARRLLSEL